MSSLSPRSVLGLASLDFSSLSAAYRAGGLTPTKLVQGLIERCADTADHAIWVCKVEDGALLARAAELEAMDAATRAAKPLWGIPFAVKDNIDVAGMPTTAACPEFATQAQAHAPVVERLLQAGAMLVGKTNMDQFATGLVGVRSPYGVPRNPFHADYIPGGSSSGSAVAVSAGLASFSLGTDTAGSGRVPAGFTNIVGLKPTKGLISTRGVVPACRSLDCVSIFALTVGDAMEALAVAAAFDEQDPFSRGRQEAPPALKAPFRFGVPQDKEWRFFGDAEAERHYVAALDRLESLGGQRVEIDYAPFRRAAELLYGGAWVAERTAAVGEFLVSNPEAGLPVIRQIILGGAGKSAVDAFRAAYALEECRAATQGAWRQIDVLALPTSGTIYRIKDVLADPIQTNSNLGVYTNFVNLLDLCGIAVPAAFRSDGLPFGITLLAPAFSEDAVAVLADRFHRATGLPLGAGRNALPPERAQTHDPRLIRLLVVGGHLSGQGLNHQLTDCGARLVTACRTAPDYRLFALPGQPPRPGMVRVAQGGVSIEGEIWEMTAADFGRFVAAIPAPLGIGRVALEGGGEVSGFLCEQIGVDGALDISSFGGWRAWRASL